MPTYPPPIHQPTRRHRIRGPLALLALGACVTLAACGSSGSASSSSSKSSTTSSSKAGGPGSGRFTALRSCLQKAGITLPPAPSGAAGQPGGPGAGAPGGARGSFQLPKGVSATQYQAALKKCGANNFGGGNRTGFNSVTARASLAKYASCLRQNGINVPAPNTSGTGPVFNTKGIDTSSAQFKAAQSKCQGLIKGVLPGRPGDVPPSGGPANGGGPAGGGEAGAAPPAFKSSPGG